MVMFTCNRCSKGLKKKDVLNHSFQCGGRSNINVACIDCLKDFRGDEYNSHTSCVSEEVRYGGKGVVAKECGKKQNQWLGIVKQVLSVNQTLDKPVRKFLQSVQHLENIPRQKKKFHNWAKSAMHIRDTVFLDQVFDILHEEFTKNKSNDTPKNTTDDAVDEQNEEPSTNGEGQQKTKKSKKRDETVEDVHSEENGLNGLDKKEKKKKRSQVEEEPVETEANEPDSVAPETSEEASTMTKKEKKMKKKKAKFEAELQEIENVQMDDDAGEEEPRKTKKSKKRKLVDENDVEKDDVDGIDGKRKKVDEDRVNGNSDEKLSNEAAASPPAKHKFKWHQMIIDVLKSSKRDEMRVKKVSKIVINEYFALYGDNGIHEKLDAKMTKKLRTCPGVVILKDKVKLLEAEE